MPCSRTQRGLTRVGIYIMDIRKGEVNISILMFDFFIAQCIIYDTFSFSNFGDP